MEQFREKAGDASVNCLVVAFIAISPQEMRRKSSLYPDHYQAAECPAISFSVTQGCHLPGQEQSQPSPGVVRSNTELAVEAEKASRFLA